MNQKYLKLCYITISEIFFLILYIYIYIKFNMLHIPLILNKKEITI